MTDIQNANVDISASDLVQPTTEKAPRVYAPFSVNDSVHISRGKHRGQDAVILVVADGEQYVVQPVGGGAPVVLNRASLREPTVGAEPSVRLTVVLEALKQASTDYPEAMLALTELANAIGLGDEFPYDESYDANV